MPDGLNAKPLRLGELFADPYVIESPPYQRPYSWTEVEASQLLDDVTETLHDTGGARGYFLGSILLVDSEADQIGEFYGDLGELPRRFEVVDGQQRLITLTILFAVLRDLEASAGLVNPDPALVTACAVYDDGGQSIYRMRPHVSDAGALDTFVLPRRATQRPVEEAELEGPGNRILEVRKCLSDALSTLDSDERSRLKAYLLEKCSLVVISTSDVDRAHQMFSALNGRGKPLSRNDILKAEILGKQDAMGSEMSVAIWNRAAAGIGIDNFEKFFSHVRTAEGSSGGQIIEAVRAISAKRGGPQAFVRDVIGPYAEIYTSILKAEHTGAAESAAINRHLTYLGWLPSSEWVPPLLLWWQRHGDDGAELLWFLEALERLSYGLRILGHGLDKRTQRFASISTAIRRGDVLTPQIEAMSLTKDERRTITYNMKDLYGRSQQTCKLVLMRLADAMAGTVSPAVEGELTVEHILPTKPSSTSIWQQWFADANQRARFCSSIGNLALLPTALNDRARNHEFTRKRLVYREADRGVAGILLHDVLDQQEWRATQIERREAQFQEMIQQLWNFKDSKTDADASPDQQPRPGRASRRRA